MRLVTVEKLFQSLPAVPEFPEWVSEYINKAAFTYHRAVETDGYLLNLKLPYPHRDKDGKSRDGFYVTGLLKSQDCNEPSYVLTVVKNMRLTIGHMIHEAL